MPRKIPASAASASIAKKKPATQGDINFDMFQPAWRIGKFDYSSRWGLASLLGEFVYHFDEGTVEKVIEKENDALYEVLKSLDGKLFSSIDDFWNKLATKYNSVIPTDILEYLSHALVREGFQTRIYPKLVSYESNTWTEILHYTHNRKGMNVTNNHLVPVANLSKEARKRLEELKYDEDYIFSLRLEAKVRIYGFRIQNYLEILWVDLNHEIYPVDND